jgi:hypothetical protein
MANAFDVFDSQPQAVAPQNGNVFDMFDAAPSTVSRETHKPLKIGQAGFEDALRETLRNTDWGTRQIAGAGTALSNLWQRGKQLVGQGDEQAIQNNRTIADEAPVGAIAGNVALLAPTALIPGANTAAGAGLIGAATGALQPTLGNESTLQNMALGGAFGAGGQQLGKLAGKGLQKVFDKKVIASDAAIASAAPVKDLYRKAQDLGIDIPADRLVNSRPLNAVSSSLNYIPFSGRAKTEEKMVSQMNRALSRTFGQDSDNVTGALRKAGADLGSKFDDVLSNNTVKIDNQFREDLTRVAQMADDELDFASAGIVKKQTDNILGKGTSAPGSVFGEIDSALSKGAGGPDAAMLKNARGIIDQLQKGKLNQAQAIQNLQQFATSGKVSKSAMQAMNKAASLIPKIDKSAPAVDSLIEGQAAYNIKKTLDRIGNRNANEAYYARELKKVLMGALDRSLPGNKAAEFAAVRKQYGNMLALENLAANGAEGGVSIGRLANLKNINNPELQDLADIAAQFIKTREAPHSAMQRVMVGGVALPAAFATGTLPVAAATVGAGRATNSVLNSNALKEWMLKDPAQANRLLGLMTKGANNETINRMLPALSAQAATGK